MKLAKTSLSGVSVALLVIQLALVSSIGAEYLYQRLNSPRVWTRAAAYDPELLMRGHYLSLQLAVDGCQSTLPSAKEAAMPRNLEGVPTGTMFSIHSPQTVRFPAQLKVMDNRLVAIRIPDSDSRPSGVMVEGMPGASCENLRLSSAVDFYVAEHAADPTRLNPGQELWVQVTVPPQGPPRPLQLALKENGAWKPLAFQ
jgi:hypothetical protein